MNELMYRLNEKISVLFLFLVLSQSAAGQSGDGMAYKLGDSDLYPSVRLDFISNNNIFLESENEVSATSFMISPDLVWKADKGQFSVTGEYNGRYLSSDESILDFTDHEFSFTSDAEFTKRSSAGGSLDVELGHQDLGTRLTRESADADTEYVQFRRTKLSLFGKYGADQARGNLEGGLRTDNLSYTNQASLTDGDDFSKIEPYGIFSLRVSPDTRALVELRAAQISYDDDLRDRSDLTALLGLTFAATGKFSGAFRVGSTFSDYEDSDVTDRSELVVQARLFYEPVSFSKFTLVVNRDIDNLSDNPTDANTVSATADLIRLDWNHRWSGRLSHRASIGRQFRDQECPLDDITNTRVSFELNLQVRRWFSVGFGGNTVDWRTEACSDDESLGRDYARQRLGVHLRATL